MSYTYKREVTAAQDAVRIEIGFSLPLKKHKGVREELQDKKLTDFKDALKEFLSNHTFYTQWEGEDTAYDDETSIKNFTMKIG
jgi:hypothetical protein